MYKVIYEKNNGEIIERIRNTIPNYKVNSITSMGWKVKAILYRYNNDYLTYEEYYRKLDKYSKKYKLKAKIKRIIKDHITKYSLSLVVLIPVYLKMILN